MIVDRKPAAGPCNAAAGNALRLMFPASDAAVRAALRQWRLAMQAAHACADLTGRAEIVLAEVLNNITEHGGATDWVGLRCQMDRAGLRVTVTDRGRPLPPELLIPASPAPASVPTASVTPASPAPAAPAPAWPAPASLSPLPGDLDPALLPEGGFGWQMIHLLTRDLACQRDANGNRLSFLVPKRPCCSDTELP
jgi:serine/threonine-protein kinase RsbW